MFSLRLLGISLGYFVVLLDSTILNVALSDLRRSLGGTVAGQQWTIASYTIAFAALLLSSGAIADRFGAARVFRFGLVAFALTSLLCALAPTLELLILFRAAQGAAAAAIPASSLSLLGELYRVPAERARAVGTWAGTSTLGLAAGPLLGGLLVGAGGWRAVFLINLPFVLAALLLVGRRLAPSPATSRALDWRSQLATATTLALVSAALIEGAEAPYRALLLAVPALLSVPVLLAAERRSHAPAFPPRLLKVRELRRLLFTGVVAQFQLAGSMFVLALYFSEHRHYSTTLSGLAFLPLVLGPSLLASPAGHLAVRFGGARVLSCGLAVGVLGDLLAAAAILASAPYPALCAALVLMGLGTPLTLVPLTTQVIDAAPEGTGGLTGGLFNAVRQMGATLGVALLGGLLALSGPATGTAWALLTTAAVLLAALLTRLNRGGGRPRAVASESGQEAIRGGAR
ncbi:MFS transporter [Actinocorallia sp. B10E7]|uniref:MFS transporter n=1 Tax=Actinocorallia sp. B10E7 TaxID=3153558 RepID=UPI00325D63B5